VGPLAGVKVVELAGLGPGPFAGMLLADLGADVLRIERPGREEEPGRGVIGRGRRPVAVDLKHPDGVECALQLAERADAFCDGYRPGVTERLGLGPDDCLARNPRLVYARVTGWGREGPLSATAGHDIDYIALAGALHQIGSSESPPVPPLNLVGDYGGGAFLAFGIVSALLETRTSGMGQVVDVAMVDTTAAMLALFWGLRSEGWSDERGGAPFAGGAPYYRTYETADGKFMAVGALEDRFYEQLLEGLGLADENLPSQHDESGWPRLHERFTMAFRSRTRDEWSSVFDRTDACVAPVLSMTETVAHPHIRARKTLVEVDGVWQHAPTPRFSRTPGQIRVNHDGTDATAEVLADWGLERSDIGDLRARGVVT
jgi:alpha-methylacyl-CoA racemase